MEKKLIDGVGIRKLQPIVDERGWLMELFRSDWKEYERFGQLYITTCYPGIVKAWHYHKKQTDNFICIKGMAKVVLYDARENSITKGVINEFFMGERNFMLLKIPPNVYHGFKAIGNREAWILNIPTEVYNYSNPDEFRVPFDSKDIPYDWAAKSG
ncbi:MAG: dTDP-4-dehydrorhamnose 3,5-epimerase family protein [Methanomassiliicoccales archaeon]|jgi:dTDP-4-dehydrorhamnose 3,5-epimerase|nr:dTDP-4-dehydrorhamnose 3,5-epimerase family protein [Methanomassiliicoccales archaeon]